MQKLCEYLKVYLDAGNITVESTSQTDVKLGKQSEQNNNLVKKTNVIFPFPITFEYL